MQEPRWIERSALLMLHEQCLADFGGLSGVRDEGLFDSALARPRNAFAYGEALTIPALAASYAFGLAKNHPFADGNKRAAFLAVGVFLFINGFDLTAPQAEAYSAVIALADGRWSEAEFAAWVETHCCERKKK